MGQFITSAWLFILGWFHPDMLHGVFWGSLLVTFVASVMGQDQQQRLEQGKFGLAAGTSLGGLSALLKDQKELIVVGFVGSAVGGLLGWLYYLALASLLVRWVGLKKLLAFQIGGLEGLQKKLDVESIQTLTEGFEIWTEKLVRMISEMKVDLLTRVGDDDWEAQAIMVIRTWLTASVDALALVFGTLKNAKENQSRVTIIIYRHSDNSAAGRHWISYAGQLKPHSKDFVFDQESIGYKVLTGALASPYFSTNEIAKKEGQTRPDDVSYRPFVTFRLNDDAIMALDWPGELPEGDDYVQSARSLFYAGITPAIAEVLERWPRRLADAAGVVIPPKVAAIGAPQVDPAPKRP